MSFTDYNKIKFIDENSFYGLNNLNKVTLRGNKCINEDFDDANAITILPRLSSEKCKSTPAENLAVHPETESCDNVKAVLEILKQIMTEREKCQSEIVNKTATISKLEAELVAATDAKTKAESQFDLIREIHKILEAHRNETVTAKIKSTELLVDNDKKSSEIHDLREKIQKLEQENEFLKHIYN